MSVTAPLRCYRKVVIKEYKPFFTVYMMQNKVPKITPNITGCYYYHDKSYLFHVNQRFGLTSCEGEM